MTATRFGGPCKQCGVPQFFRSERCTDTTGACPYSTKPKVLQPPTERQTIMHYRNGREAKNGDTIIRLSGGNVDAFGKLQDAVPGNDYCNGDIVHEGGHKTYACLCDCLHVEDVAAMLAEKGLDKRPEGK